MKISLDSNIFADQDFIDWLQDNNQHFNIFLSVITALETYHWYNTRGISQELFNKDIKSLNASIQNLSIDQIHQISKYAKSSNLQFKHDAKVTNLRFIREFLQKILM